MGLANIGSKSKDRHAVFVVSTIVIAVALGALFLRLWLGGAAMSCLEATDTLEGTPEMWRQDVQEAESLEIIDSRIHNQTLVLEESECYQLEVKARLANGNRVDITSSSAGTQYKSSDTSVIKVAAGGLLRAMHEGVGDVTIIYGQKESALKVIVSRNLG
jgi:hypothetical protein